MLDPSVLSMTITRVLCLSHALIVPVSLYQAWFYEHIDNPYPEIVDITELCVRTGMTMVSRFANVSPLVIHDITLIFSGSSHSLVQFSTPEIGTQSAVSSNPGPVQRGGIWRRKELCIKHNTFVIESAESSYTCQ